MWLNVLAFNNSQKTRLQCGNGGSLAGHLAVWHDENEDALWVPSGSSMECLYFSILSPPSNSRQSLSLFLLAPVLKFCADVLAHPSSLWL